ncbi:MAG: GFA family protein [Rudaea sp.]
MRIRGSCHCGNIGFELDWLPEPAQIPARACTCSFCSKHGGVWTACPTGALIVTLRNPSTVSAYRFGTKTAEFHVCATCGGVPVVTSEIDGNVYAVVNVNTFENLDSSLLQHTSITLDDEDEAARLARRARNWIAKVEFREPC